MGSQGQEGRDGAMTVRRWWQVPGRAAATSARSSQNRQMSRPTPDLPHPDGHHAAMP